MAHSIDSNSLPRERLEAIQGLIQKGLVNQINDEAVRNFLHSPAGYDLIFDAIDMVARAYFGTGDIPVFFSREKFSGRKIDRLVDVHTHCAGPDLGGSNADAFHARGMWWFCPDRYKRLTATPEYVAVGKSNGVRIVSTLYGDYDFLLNNPLRRNPEIQQAKFILSNAPNRNRQVFIAPGDMPSYVNNANAAGDQSTSFLGSGWISDGTTSNGFDGTPPKIWKYYETVSDQNPQFPLMGDNDPLPRACLDLLRRFPNDQLIVCLHFGQEFGDTNAGSVAWGASAEIGEKVRRFLKKLSGLGEGRIRFVIYHAGFNEHWYVAQCMEQFDNLFADTAAMFSENLLALGHAPNPQHPARIFREMLADAPVLNGDQNPAVARQGIASNQFGKRLLWGTDSIWRGSPYWEAEAFERLNISGEKTEPSWEREFKKRVLYKNADALLGN